jgi:hypothetical protein
LTHWRNNNNKYTSQWNKFRKNLILVNVIEERWIDSADYSTTNTTRLLTQRELSQAMIPGTHLAKVEVEKMVYDSKMAPHLPTTTLKS